MNPKPFIRLLTLLVCFTSAAPCLRAAQRQVSAVQVVSAVVAQAAIAAAQPWLATVDAGQYAESWNGTSGYFQSNVTKARWEQELNRFRKPLGSLVFRTLQSVRHSSGPAGGLSGRYVVLQYKSAFAYKLTAIETVSVQSQDGQWRIAGYYIK